MFKRIVPILIIIALLAPSFVRPEPVQASVLGTGVSFGSCAAAGYLSGLISKGLSELENFVKNKLKNWLGSAIGGILGGKVPVTDSGVQNAVNNFKGAYTGKENIQDLIARCTAREILIKMGRDITNVARTGGRDGGAAFVRNWRNHETDAQYRGEDIFRNIMASTRLCNYFGNEVKNVFGVLGRKSLGRINTRINSMDSYQLSAGCTMPSAFNMNSYKNDFEGNGGWNAANRLLEPQNNFYGILFKSMDEAVKQRALESRADINEVIAGGGFTSTRGRSAADSCSVRGWNGKCLVYKDIKTPGGVLQGAVIAGIESELQWVASSDELNEVIASAITVLVNRLIDLSSANEGDYIVPGDPVVSITPIPPGNNCDVITEEEGANARYESDVDSAISAFLAANPSIANASSGDDAILGQFLYGVAEVLSGRGFESGRVINCNGNVSSDSIYVGRPGDLYGDYFDLASGTSRDNEEPISAAAQSLFIEWAASHRLIGGGGNNTAPTPETPTP